MPVMFVRPFSSVPLSFRWPMTKYVDLPKLELSEIGERLHA